MPRLSLSDPRWPDLLGGYRTPGDFPALLAALADDPSDTADLWDALHHQEDVDSGSYAALPYLLDVAKAQAPAERGELLGLAALVLALSEADRNPDPPIWMAAQMEKDRQRLGKLALATLGALAEADETTVSGLLGCVAVAKGQASLGHLLLDWQEEWHCSECGAEMVPEEYEL